MGLISFVKGVFRKMLDFRTISQAESVTTPLSPEMQNALQLWESLYTGRAFWLFDKDNPVKSMNLPAFISSELARQITLEMNVSISGKNRDHTTDKDGDLIQNDRSLFLSFEFEKLLSGLRQKLEQGCAAGGMIIKPYPADGHLYFDVSLAWDIYPLAFDNAGNLQDVIIPDFYSDGKDFYTRLERHTLNGQDVTITNRAYKSSSRDQIGKEVSLESVERWRDLEPEVTIKDAGGQLFGFFKVASANAIDLRCPLGASCFSKAVDAIREADEQYTRLLWEFEGSELAIDVDPMALMQRDGQRVLPKHAQRLFRAIDLEKSGGDLYEVFSPQIRDSSLMAGLNAILQRVEDLCGISRGAISDANDVAKTATELTIQKQRSYATVADNQKALEHCLRDVIRAMDVYATLYDLCPIGETEISFDWDDSIVVDSEKQMMQMMTLVNAGIVSKTEFRKWYFKETDRQASQALEAVNREKDADFDSAFKTRNE